MRKSNDVPIERLRQLVDYDPGTGIFRWKENKAQCAKAGSVAGGLNSHGYYKIKFDGITISGGRVAWALAYGEWPTKLIDHINRDKADNRISNLRVATDSQNCANKGVWRTSVSQIKGVRQLRGKWHARICVEGKSMWLGTFQTPDDASAAYVNAATKFFGEFAHA